MAEFPAMPLWTDAYLADTTHLTTIEHGAYFLLIITAWRAKTHILPNDDYLLSRYCRLTLKQWKRMRPRLEPFFIVTAEKWAHGKVLDEVDAVRRRVNQRITAGKSSALKRLHRGSTTVATPSNENPTTTTITTKKKDILGDGWQHPLLKGRANGHAKNGPEEDTPEFLRFWSVFPNKAKREVAKIALAKALKITTIEVILAALAWQVPRWKDPDFYPHAATWLNQKRWNEERPAQPPQPKFLIPR